MTDQLPTIVHTYQNHTLDSTRWHSYQPRPDDIIIATAYKSGTTWMQEIVRQLIFVGQAAPQRDEAGLWDVSPWLEMRGAPLAEIMTKLEAQHHRRFIKTHLALDGLPYFPQVKYIVVGRDARDVAMSLWNHYANFTEAVYENNDPASRVGDPLPPCPADIHDYWRTFFTRGWFAWEREGYPFWGNLHHTQTWWDYRHLPNLLFVHYNDLLTDLPGEIQRIADFLQIPLADGALAAILPAVHLPAMRDRAERLDPLVKTIWKEGAKTFYFQGTNGRWKDVLSAEELRLYDEGASRVLSPDCRTWLESGRVALQCILLHQNIDRNM
jgi:aryl sulfotransferase